MNSNNDQDSRDEATADIDALLRLGVQVALANSDFKSAFESFLAEWQAQPTELTKHIEPEAVRPIGLAFFREIWNHTPRPDLGWKRLSVPRPERNGACLCGSGKKYKQCCGPMEGNTPFPPGGLSVLCYVLETIPVSGYSTMPFRQLDPEEVAHVASEWHKDGRIEPATLLLEALLAAGNKLDARHEYAFDVLADLYLDANRAEERLALVERIMQVPDRRLRSAAWQRRATLHADRGEYVKAWEAFKEAQRLEPDNPSLAHLELMLLANEDRYDEAQRRAAFWAKRLSQLGYAGERIVELMEEVARDPDILRAMISDDEDDSYDEPAEATLADVTALQALIGKLPGPACNYQLSPHDAAAGPLEATPELAAIECDWEEVYWGNAEERDPWTDRRWLDWLRTHPLAWQSFPVIEDLLDIFEESLFPDDADDQIDAMEDALLGHAVAILRAVLAENRAEGCKLEWGWMENRPALRLLMRSIDHAHGREKELPLLEWLVLTLNPNDNGGHRERLVHAYCEAGRPAEALAVCDRYPNDGLPGTLYGRVLALYLLDRRGDAVAALANATKRLPKVLKTLVAKRPKLPPLTPGTTTHGGDDQAWMYRVHSYRVWEICGAMEWLREMAGPKG